MKGGEDKFIPGTWEAGAEGAKVQSQHNVRGIPSYKKNKTPPTTATTTKQQNKSKVTELERS